MRFFIFATLVGILAAVSLWWKTEHDRVIRYDRYIAEASAKHKVHPELIRAVIWKESAFDEKATGLAKERGLMQVTPVAGQEWADAQKMKNFKPDDLFDPRKNINAGSWYLGRALRRWKHADEPEFFALAEYNAGRTHALRWAKDLNPPVASAFFDRIDYPTTKAYIHDIVERYNLYRTQKHPGPFTTLWERVTRKCQKLFDRKKKSQLPPPEVVA